MTGLVLFQVALMFGFTTKRTIDTIRDGKKPERTEAQHRDWIFGLVMAYAMICVAVVGVVKYWVDWF